MAIQTTYNGTGAGSDYAIDELILSLSTLKTWLRVDGTDEDAILKAIRSTAREFVEQYCQIQLNTEASNYTSHFAGWPSGDGLDSLPVFRLPRHPATAIASVKYYDSAGTLQTLDPSKYKTTVADGRGRVAVNDCPALDCDHPAPVEITFTAGFTPATAPAAITQAMMMICAHHYEFRGDQMNNGRPFPYSDAVRSLLDRHLHNTH